jgi:hypothetical protein
MAIYCSCISCHSQIVVQQLTNHYQSKLCLAGGKQPAPLSHCPHCNIEVATLNSVAGHVKWCVSNPNRPSPKFVNGRTSWNKGLTKDSNQSLKSMADKLSVLHASGVLTTEGIVPYQGAPRSQETRELISNKALSNKYQRKCKNSHEFTDKRGRKFTFDSSWEDALAIRLDELDIVWDRPKPIEYEIDDKIRNYFPDFYLPDHDLYLDPKNPYCQQQQSAKIKVVSTMINLIILGDLESCKSFKI